MLNQHFDWEEWEKASNSARIVYNKNFALCAYTSEDEIVKELLQHFILSHLYCPDFK